MTDLTLALLFEQAAERVGHEPFCNAARSYPGPCYCRHEARLLALCARMSEAAVDSAASDSGDSYMIAERARRAAARVLEASDG